MPMQRHCNLWIAFWSNSNMGYAVHTLRNGYAVHGAVPGALYESECMEKPQDITVHKRGLLTQSVIRKTNKKAHACIFCVHTYTHHVCIATT
jgi:hypothetical protein